MKADCRRGGQAMVEFVVGLVALLALFAGLLQLAALTRAHTDAMAAAREQAGERALLDTEPAPIVAGTPDYIRDWNPGPDRRSYSRDDRFTGGNQAFFDRVIVERAADGPSGWSILDSLPENRLTGLHCNPNPVARFGLVRGRERAGVPMISAAQELLYHAREIEIEANVWMTWMKGIY